MALEIEAKFRVETHDDVRRRLETLGATYLGRVLETNHILDRNERPLRDQGCGLRVRTTIPESGSATAPEPQASACADIGTSESQVSTSETDKSRAKLTYKGPRQPGPLKIREEIETEVADGKELIRMLERLGFQPVLVYEKRRESWELGGCRIELDEPPYIGLFVEIEGPDETHIRNVQSQLDLPNHNLVRESYVRLLVDYCEKHAIPPEGLTLER